MSTTCALMSSRPSSNTAKRPTGPAPTIRASVLITSFGMNFRSELLVGDADHEPFEILGHLDLAGEPALRPNVEGKIEHVLLHLLGLAGLLAPRFVNVDVACRTGAGPAAFGGNAGDRILHRGLHHRHAGLRLDDALNPIVLDKGNPGHVVGARGDRPNIGGSGQRLTLAPEDEREKACPLAARAL